MTELPDVPIGAPFDGETIKPEADQERLNAQTLRVFTVMRDQEWRTLSEIAAASGDPEASISARLRDLRKEKFGKYVVERRRRGEEKRGLHEYRVLPPLPKEDDDYDTE